jgi:cysteinyl-tRNA synthetase
MSLRVYNTLTKNKESFQPVVPGKVGIYLCGPTVYKPSHIGHMVGPVIFDTIKKYLVYSGFDVMLVINVTDVDDKLIAEAEKRRMSMADLAVEMTTDYMENLAAMGVDSVDSFPRATDNIPQIIEFIQSLIQQGFAYASDGDVYFDVGKYPEYGKLSHRNLDELQGEGGDMARRKHSPFDFALWKGAKAAEPSWESPWGPGRPGWHIECSVMGREILGREFDIHGGGLDLVFPHHENEIAQSECRDGCQHVKYWLHNGLMQAADEVGKLGGRNTRHQEATAQASETSAAVGDSAAAENAEDDTAGANTTAPDEQDAQNLSVTKISKSTGATAFNELLQQVDAETIRFFLLSTHYRRPIYYSMQRLDEVATAMETFYRFFKRYERITAESFYEIQPPATRDAGGAALSESAEALELFGPLRERYLSAMDDDFNTGGAIGDLFELVRGLNKMVDQQGLEAAEAPSEASLATLRRGTTLLRELAVVLGLFRTPRTAPSAASQGPSVAPLCDLLVEIRAEARAEKNFAIADAVRDALASAGIRLEDRSGRTEWALEAQAEDDDRFGKLVQSLIDLRTQGRVEKQFALADKIRDGMTTAGVRLEDRADGTDWTLVRS